MLWICSRPAAMVRSSAAPTGLSPTGLLAAVASLASESRSSFSPL
jgi:hypothetical protein